jgi:hypothetical protein
MLAYSVMTGLTIFFMPGEVSKLKVRFPAFNTKITFFLMAVICPVFFIGIIGFLALGNKV